MSDARGNRIVNENGKNAPDKAGDYARMLKKWGLIVVGLWLGYLFGSYLLAWLGWVLLPDAFLLGGGVSMGAFGDYFGALHALFAGLAFAGIIVTIRQQSAEIQATRDEMREQTRQLKREDVYRRLEIIQQLKKEISTEGYNHFAPDIFSEKRGHDVCLLACFANDIIKAFSEDNAKRKLRYLEVAKECLYTCQLWTGPWLSSISCLLEDIATDYKDDKAETIRLFRIVLATFDMATRQLICLHEGVYISPKIMPTLREAGLCEKKDDACKSAARNKMVRELFIQLATTEKSVEEVLRAWDCHSTANR